MKPPSSVVILNDFCHVQGGASRVAVDEAVALAERGLDVTFLGATGPIGPELLGSRVRTICLEQPELAAVARNPQVAWQGLWNVEAGRRVGEVLSTLPKLRTIVHLHGYTKSLTTSVVRETTKAGYPLIVTLHDYFSVCPTGNLFDYVRAKPCPVRPMSSRCVATNCDKRRYAHKLYRVARGAMQRWPGLMPSAIQHYIGLSAGSVASIRPQLPQGARVYPLPNIIDIPRSAPVVIRESGSLLFIGRLDAEKGIQLLLDAAERTGVSIVFAGEGPLRPAIEARGRHRVTGWITSGKIAHELDQAKCLIFPSVWQETFGLVVDEAAARGVPAIVSHITGAAERIRDGVTGILFRSGDTNALAAAISATNDTTRLSAMGKKAYDGFWLSPPDRENHVKRLLEIYASVLDTSVRTTQVVPA